MSIPASLAKVVGRRGLLALIGGAAAAAPTLGKRTPNAGNGMEQPGVPLSGGRDSVRDSFWDRYYRGQQRRNYRLDGYSTDIHAMRSWSPGFKALAQFNRDEDEKGAWQRLAESLGLKDINL